MVDLVWNMLLWSPECSLGLCLGVAFIELRAPWGGWAHQ